MNLQRAQSWPCAHFVANSLAPRVAAPVAVVPPTRRQTVAKSGGAPLPAARSAGWRVPVAQGRPCPFHRTSVSATLRCVGVPAAALPPRGGSPHVPAPLQTRTSRGQRHSNSGQRGSVAMRSGWGAPVDFKGAKVVSNTLEAAGMHKILVDIGQELAAKYTRPGQYIQAKVQPEGKAGFFAIASAPDANNQGVVELLIKVQPGATAEEICKLAAGAPLLVSAPMGGGFPVERIPASSFDTVLLFATGSGISPIKAVIDSDVLEVGKRKEVRLYYGSRSPELTAYKNLIPEWKAKGIKVVQVLSGDAKKYVQGAFAEDAAKLTSPATVGVLLCGQKDMSIAIKDICKDKGVPQEAVLSNF